MVLATAAPPAPAPAAPTRRFPSALGALVEGLPGVLCLHDRRLPDGRRLAHVAVGPSGVWLVEGRRWEGARLRAGAAHRDGRPPTLLVDRVDRRPVIADLLDRAEQLTRLAGEELFWHPARGLLCVAGARWPRLGGALHVDGVRVCWPAGMARAVGGSRLLDPAEVRRLHDELGALLG